MEVIMFEFTHADFPELDQPMLETTITTKLKEMRLKKKNPKSIQQYNTK